MIFLTKKQLTTSRFGLWLFFLTLFILPLFIEASCATVSPLQSEPEKQAAAKSPEAVLPRWLPLAEDSSGGLAYYAGKIATPRLDFYVLRVDLANPQLRIVVRPGAADSNAGDAKPLSVKVSSFVRDNALLAGINALPFDPVSGREGEPRTNIGLVVSDGTMLAPPHPGFDALVFYADNNDDNSKADNNRALGAAVVSQSDLQNIENIANAVGGFCQILDGGELAARVLNLDARHPRSAAGLSADARILYLLVIDGRRPGSVGATEAETALLLRALGAHNGINFDGGGSSALVLRYPDGKVRPVNVPIHNLIPGRERAVAACLGIGIKK